MAKKEQKLVSLMLYVRNQKTKDGKRTFKSYSTKMTFNENGEQKERYVRVKFPKDVDVNKLSRGLIQSCPSDISAPSEYKVIEKEDGTKEYPVVWVRKIEKFTPIHVDHVFNFVVEELDTDEIDIEDSEESEK